jgi:hypothetical protein
MMSSGFLPHLAICWLAGITYLKVVLRGIDGWMRPRLQQHTSKSRFDLRGQIAVSRAKPPSTSSEQQRQQ